MGSEIGILANEILEDCDQGGKLRISQLAEITSRDTAKLVLSGHLLSDCLGSSILLCIGFKGCVMMN